MIVPPAAYDSIETNNAALNILARGLAGISADRRPWGADEAIEAHVF